MNTKKNPVQTPIITITNSDNFQLVESYKALRTNLLFSHSCQRSLSLPENSLYQRRSRRRQNHHNRQSCLNARRNRNPVLLIDADMRKPTIHRYFSLDNRLGLSNLLSGMNKKSECIQSLPDQPNLSVIPSGVLPPNPSELLGSAAMEKLLAELEESYDYILIDTPAGQCRHRRDRHCRKSRRRGTSGLLRKNHPAGDRAYRRSSALCRCQPLGRCHEPRGKKQEFAVFQTRLRKLPLLNAPSLPQKTNGIRSFDRFSAKSLVPAERSFTWSMSIHTCCFISMTARKR